jgi:hypothetical protein
MTQISFPIEGLAKTGIFFSFTGTKSSTTTYLKIP